MSQQQTIYVDIGISFFWRRDVSQLVSCYTRAGNAAILAATADGGWTC